MIYLVPEGHDITHRKQQEIAIRSVVNKLQESNRELEQFAYIASHDLRSPLRGIAQIASFLRDDEGDRLSDSSHKFLDTLEGRVKRMENLLDDLLSYSRIGKQPEHRQPVNTAALIEDIVDLLPVPSEFQVVTSGSLPTFETYLTPLRQIFMNLIDNAVKHHDKQQGRIEISLADLGDYYEFLVTDDGPGIEPELQEKIFEMFKTLQSRYRVEGSGMGLTIVRKLVRHFGGNIRIESTPGNGSCFLFTWPKHEKGDNS